MSFKVLIIDDEQHAIDAISRLVKKMPDLRLIASETDPIAALNKITSGALNVDIVFLDIGMEEMQGDEFCRHLGNRAVVIFVTGHTEYALAAFRLGAVDYLIKPIQTGDFIEAVDKAREKLIAWERSIVVGPLQQYAFIKLGPKNIFGLDLNELIYIKSDDKYIYLHITGGKPLMIKKTLNYMVDILPKDQFLRTHQSFLVNVAYVKGLVGNKILLKNDEVLNIGSTYQDKVYSRF